MVSVEEYLKYLDAKTGEIAGHTAKTAAYYSRMAGFLSNLYEGHSQSKMPLVFGSIDQTAELLDRLGKWEQYEKGIPGTASDDMLAYFNEGAPGRIVTGRESESQTPVGIVSHPAPLDATSWLYWSPLIVQAIEQSYKSIKPGIVHDGFEEKLDAFEASLDTYVTQALAEARGIGNKPQTIVVQPQPTSRRRPTRRPTRPTTPTPSTARSPSSCAQGLVDAHKNETIIHVQGDLIMDNQSNKKETKDYSGTYIS